MLATLLLVQDMQEVRVLLQAMEAQLLGTITTEEGLPLVLLLLMEEGFHLQEQALLMPHTAQPDSEEDPLEERLQVMEEAWAECQWDKWDTDQMLDSHQDTLLLAQLTVQPRTSMALQTCIQTQRTQADHRALIRVDLSRQKINEEVVECSSD
jgi:hypothetical protein